jgi:hypothetical protein
MEESLEGSRVQTREEQEHVKVLRGIHSMLILLVFMATGAALSAAGSTNVGVGALCGFGLYLCMYMMNLITRRCS